MMSCPRHPLAAAHAGHCPACLMEGAFFEPEAAEGGRRRELTILIPLGGSPGSTVFLVREHGARGRLMRLKTWDRPAPPGFLAEFERLRTRLEAWGGAGIEVPEAAAVDAGGRAFVLNGFRRGTAIVGQVRTGRLDAGRAAGFFARSSRPPARRTPPDWFMVRSAPVTSCRTAAPHSSWTSA